MLFLRVFILIFSLIRIIYCIMVLKPLITGGYRTNYGADIHSVDVLKPLITGGYRTVSGLDICPVVVLKPLITGGYRTIAFTKWPVL